MTLYTGQAERLYEKDDLPPHLMHFLLLFRCVVLCCPRNMVDAAAFVLVVGSAVLVMLGGIDAGNPSVL